MTKLRRQTESFGGTIRAGNATDKLCLHLEESGLAVYSASAPAAEPVTA